MSKKEINCPIMEEKIDEGTCFDIHMKVEGVAPDWSVPEEVINTPNYQDICLQCPNHRED